MKSLEYLNTHGQTSVSATDNRYAKVIFDRPSPLSPIDQVYNITGTSVSVTPGIEIVDIINPDICNVVYEITINTGSSPVLVSSLTFPTMPSGVTLDVVGSTYTITGISSASDWDTIKSFTWNLASNWASCPFWFLESSITYYDEELGEEISKSWITYDDGHYWVAQINAEITLSIDALKTKKTPAALESTATIILSADKVRNASCTVNSVSSMVAEGTIMVAILTSNITLVAAAKKTSRATISLTPTATLSINPTPIYTDDLRMQIYHDASRPTFRATVKTYNCNCTVYWGDGTHTDYTATGTGIRTFTVSNTYSGTGYKDIKIVADAVMQVLPSSSTDAITTYCYIYKVYNWSRVATQGYSMYFGDSLSYTARMFGYQVYLNEVPNYLPTNVTTLGRVFYGCISLNHSNISSWNTSSITEMYETFYGCSSFNQPVNSWNVSNCTKLIGVFRFCPSFNQPVNSWNVSNATSLSSLFEGCSSFNQALPWTIKSGSGNTEIMYAMLKGCSSFNQDLSTLIIPRALSTDAFSRFMIGCTSFSSVNYNKFLISLANQVFSYRATTPNTYPSSIRLDIPLGLTKTSTIYGTGTYKTGLSAFNFLTQTVDSVTQTLLINVPTWKIYDEALPVATIQGFTVEESTSGSNVSLKFRISINKKPQLGSAVVDFAINTAAGTATPGDGSDPSHDYNDNLSVTSVTFTEIIGSPAHMYPYANTNVPDYRDVYVQVYDNAVTGESAETVIMDLDNVGQVWYTLGDPSSAAGTITQPGS